jgi:hypothetical protein
VLRDVRGALLRLRKRQERDVHGVVAVEIGIENQVRRVARVGNHRPHVGDEMRVPLVDRRRLTGAREGLEPGPFPPDRVERDVIALALLQLIGGEFESRTELGLHGIERGQGVVHRCLRLRERGGLCLVAVRLRDGRLPVGGQPLEQCLERPLVLVPVQLQTAELDVGVDRRDHEVHGDAQRQRERRADEQEAPRDAETIEPMQ